MLLEPNKELIRKQKNIRKKVRQNVRDFVEKDYSKGVLIINLNTNITPETLKSSLPHALRVEYDPRFGTCHSEMHHSFLVTFEESKRHRPDGEIYLLPKDYFCDGKINYEYAGDNFGDSLYRLVQRVYGNECFILGNVKKEITANQIQELIPISNCVFENHESTYDHDNESRKSFIISCNDIANFIFYARSLPLSFFVNSVKRYCPIHIDVKESSLMLAKNIDGTNDDKTVHRTGSNRFVVANLPITVDSKKLMHFLSHAGTEGDKDDFESLEKLNSGARHAFIVSFVSLSEEIELQMLADLDFDGMRIKYGYIKTTPSDCVKSLMRYQNNTCGNWMQINITREELDSCKNDDILKEKLILSKTPEITPQMIVWENETTAHVDYITKEECEKAKAIISSQTAK